MSLYAVTSVNYSGVSGALLLRGLQQDLADALGREDWALVRRLDQTCGVLIDKIICANKDESKALLLALSELKDVYATLIMQCQCKVAVMAS